jgi:hypothetical protein
MRKEPTGAGIAYLLHIDAEREPVRARRAFDTNLARAKMDIGVAYKQLLRGTTTVWSSPDMAVHTSKAACGPSRIAHQAVITSAV